MDEPLNVLFINSFITGIGVGFIIPVMVLFYTEKFNIDPVGIGTIISLSGFVGLLASYIAGRYSDKVGRKPLIALGNYSSALAGGIIHFTGFYNSGCSVSKREKSRILHWHASI